MNGHRQRMSADATAILMRQKLPLFGPCQPRREVSVGYSSQEN